MRHSVRRKTDKFSLIKNSASFIHQQHFYGLLKHLIPTVATAFFLTSSRLVTVNIFITKMCAIYRDQMQDINLRIISTGFQKKPLLPTVLVIVKAHREEMYPDLNLWS